VAGGGGAAHDAPDERHPGHGLGELKADLPDIRGLLAAADAEELADAGTLLLVLLALLDRLGILGRGGDAEGGRRAASDAK